VFVCGRYSKKEVKTQLGYAANIYGMAEVSVSPLPLLYLPHTNTQRFT
jgi:hypothetical protein